MEKLKPSHTTCRDAKWCRHFGKLSGSSSQRRTIWPSNATLMHTRKIQNICPHKNLHTGIHRSVIHNSGKNPNVHRLIHGWIRCGKSVQWNVICQKKKKKNEVLRHNIKNPAKHHAKETSQSQKTTYYMIPFMWNVQNRENYTERKVRDWLELRRWWAAGVAGWLLKGTGFLLGRGWIKYKNWLRGLCNCEPAKIYWIYTLKRWDV